MSQRFEEEHCKIESDSVVGSHYHLGELRWQHRRALLRIAVAIAAILNCNHLEILHETQEPIPSNAEYRCSRYLAGIYPVDMERCVFRRRAHYGREAGTLASWI